MIDHFGLNVSDLARSKAFYEAALAPLRYRIAKEIPGIAIGFGCANGFGTSPDPAGDFWIAKATPITTPMHFAFSAASRDIVTAFFDAAINAGGKSNGEPGVRPQYHSDYFAAFVIDPDGHNIEAVHHGVMAPRR
jgi:catechol 2,3-dioxygenase-like lactoylglutathione lyase family enzyme